MSGELGYDLHPTTFNDLLASVIGQTERAVQFGGLLPLEECVVLTAPAMLEMVQIVADLRGRVSLLEAASGAE